MDGQTQLPGGSLEYDVLVSLWDASEGVLVTELHKRICRRRKIGRASVVTVLQRLCAKQLVTRWPERRHHLYRVIVARRDIDRALSRKALATISGMTTKQAAETIVEALASLDPSLVDELAAALTVSDSPANEVGTPDDSHRTIAG